MQIFINCIISNLDCFQFITIQNQLTNEGYGKHCLLAGTGGRQKRVYKKCADAVGTGSDDITHVMQYHQSAGKQKAEALQWAKVSVRTVIGMNSNGDIFL